MSGIRWSHRPTPPNRYILGARLRYWAALSFVIGYQLVGTPAGWTQ